jgi:hypothetical protein
MRNVSDQIFSENESTYFLFSNFSPGNLSDSQLTLKNMVEPYRPQMAIQYGAFALYAG